MRTDVLRKSRLVKGSLAALIGLIGLLAIGCSGEETTAGTIIQVANPQAQAPAGVAPSGWDTEWSQLMEVRLLQTFDSSGPELWNAADHPMVYFASEGPGYGGLTTDNVTLPGYQAIDAKTH